MGKKKQTKDDRQLELSSMLLKMGQSLINEGTEKKDYIITSCGTWFMLIAGIIFSAEDTHSFSELCSMFSSKKILETMALNGEPLIDLFKTKSDNETYEEFINRINKLRGDLGHEPIK